jgi:hypothetical protein
MSQAAELIERHAAELRGIAGTLGESFAEAAVALEERLGNEDLREWARIGLGLARISRRSPEVALAFFETSPALATLDIPGLSRWAEISVGLADRAPRAAAAFIEATPAAFARLKTSELEAWAGQSVPPFSSRSHCGRSTGSSMWWPGSLGTLTSWLRCVCATPHRC